MTLHCNTTSRFAFTPGRDYLARPGGLTEAGYYVDVRDDLGILQRFGLRPRRGVTNEHPLEDLDRAFDLPQIEPTCDNEFDYVLQAIARGGFERPLIIAPRFGANSAKTWVLALNKRASTEVRQLVRPSDYNAMAASGALPAAIYVTHLRDQFLTRDGNPAPAILGSFDFLYVDPMVR